MTIGTIDTNRTKAEDSGLKRINPSNAERDFREQRSPITPNSEFFQRNHAKEIPQITADAYRLGISGIVRKPVVVSMHDILLAGNEGVERTISVTTECAGNGRSGIKEPLVVPGEPWGYGAVSTARWTGIPLTIVLSRAELGPKAMEVVFTGADGFARSLGIDKIHDDVILAYRMNGEEIPNIHGGPIRLIVPMNYGMDSIKWPVNIEVIDHRFEGKYQKDRYIFDNLKELCRPVANMRVHSIISELGDGDAIVAGPITLKGFAWSGNASIEKVEVSTDKGVGWNNATLLAEMGPYAWRQWEYEWTASAGKATLMSRAYDKKGNVQPMEPVYSTLGYENNAVQAIQVKVRPDSQEEFYKMIIL